MCKLPFLLTYSLLLMIFSYAAAESSVLKYDQLLQTARKKGVSLSRWDSVTSSVCASTTRKDIAFLIDSRNCNKSEYLLMLQMVISIYRGLEDSERRRVSVTTYGGEARTIIEMDSYSNEDFFMLVVLMALDFSSQAKTSPLAEALSAVAEEYKTLSNVPNWEELSVVIITKGPPKTSGVYEGVKKHPSNYLVEVVPAVANEIKALGAQIFLLGVSTSYSKSLEYYSGVSYKGENKVCESGPRFKYKCLSFDKIPSSFPVMSSNSDMLVLEDDNKIEAYTNDALNRICKNNISPTTPTVPTSTTMSPILTPSPPPTGLPKEMCAADNATDLLVLLDASNSMDPEKFKFDALELVLTLYDSLDRDLKNRFGIIIFSSEAKVELPLGLYSRGQILDKIENIKDSCCECCTPIAEAFRAAETEMNRNDVGNNKITVIITDGYPYQVKTGIFRQTVLHSSEYLANTVPEAAKALKSKARLILIGIPNKRGISPDSAYFEGKGFYGRNNICTTVKWKNRKKRLCQPFRDELFPIVSTPVAENLFIAENWDAQLLKETSVNLLCKNSFKFIPPTGSPSNIPTFGPTTRMPSVSPSTSAPTTGAPTAQPVTSIPTLMPTTSYPSTSPTTSKPTATPVTSAPSQKPSSAPTTSFPSYSPTLNPVTSAPTYFPTTLSPTYNPSQSPTASPTTTPTVTPSSNPTLSPSRAPTGFSRNVVFILDMSSSLNHSKFAILLDLVIEAYKNMPVHASSQYGVVLMTNEVKTSIPLKVYGENDFSTRLNLLKSECCNINSAKPVAEALESGLNLILNSERKYYEEIILISGGWPKVFRNSNNAKVDLHKYLAETVPLAAASIKQEDVALAVLVFPDETESTDAINYYLGESYKGLPNRKICENGKCRFMSSPNFPIISEPVQEYAVQLPRWLLPDMLDRSLRYLTNTQTHHPTKSPTSDPTSSPTSNPTQLRCTSGDRDVIFLLDASASLNKANYKTKMLQLVKDSYNSLDKAFVNRVAVITFNKDIILQLPLDSYAEDDFINRIDALKDICCYCCTPMAEALDLAADLLNYTYRNPWVYQDVIIITDGYPFFRNSRYNGQKMEYVDYLAFATPASAMRVKSLNARLTLIGVPSETQGPPGIGYFTGVDWKGKSRICEDKKCRDFDENLFPLISTPMNESIHIADDWDYTAMLHNTRKIICNRPTPSPTPGPTLSPLIPSNVPTIRPSGSPSKFPTTAEPSFQPSISPTLFPTGSPTSSPSYSPVCKETGVRDVLFLIDGSNSMDRSRFRNDILDLVKETYMSIYNIPGSRVGVIVFQKTVTVEMKLKTRTPEDFLTNLMEIKNKCCKCCTPMATAFDAARKEILRSGAQEGASLDVVVITDGYPFQNLNGYRGIKLNPGKYLTITVPKASYNLKKLGARVLLVGVPNRENRAPGIEYFKGESYKNQTEICHENECFALSDSPYFPMVSSPAEDNIYIHDHWEDKDLIRNYLKLLCEEKSEQTGKTDIQFGGVIDIPLILAKTMFLKFLELLE